MSGPYYFAWVEATETTFVAGDHARADEEIFSFAISQDEGDFATLELEIINPRVGLLAPGRKVWAYFSYDRNWLAHQNGGGGSPDIRPLFFGRLVALPDNIDGEVVTLNFIARPLDYVQQKIIYADTLKMRPYWDPIWFSPDTVDDPDNVLESRPELWAIDRVTGDVTTSNILEGEDGVITFDEGDIFYDSVQVNYGATPLSRVDVIASVSWDQHAAANFDISKLMTLGDAHSILTYTGAGLQSNWPKAGSSLSGGWSVIAGDAVRVDGIGGSVWGYGLHNQGPAGPIGGDPFGQSHIASDEFHDVVVPAWASAYSINVSGLGNASFPAHILSVPRWRLVPTLVVGYDVTRGRTEQLAFSLSADTQSILTDPGDDNVEMLSFSSSELLTPVDANGDSGALQPAILDQRARAFFSTDRGEQSIEYLIALARAHILSRARCVNIEFEVDFNAGVDEEISLRKDVFVSDYRLPGGSAAGKITSYHFSGSGEGRQTCSITIGCSVGRGNTFSAVNGTPDYVADGYVENGYQTRTGQYVMPIAGAVLYESLNGVPPNDDGIDFTKLTAIPGVHPNVVVSLSKTNGADAQAAAMGLSADEPNEVFARLNLLETTYTLQLLPLTGGPFQTLYNLSVSALSVPKTIDLEAGEGS